MRSLDGNEVIVVFEVFPYDSAYYDTVLAVCTNREAAVQEVMKRVRERLRPPRKMDPEDIEKVLREAVFQNPLTDRAEFDALVPQCTSLADFRMEIHEVKNAEESPCIRGHWFAEGSLCYESGSYTMQCRVCATRVPADIYPLEMPVRLRNALEMYTGDYIPLCHSSPLIDEIITLHPGQFLAMRGFGKKSLEDLYAVFRKSGIRYKWLPEVLTEEGGG